MTRTRFIKPRQQSNDGPMLRLQVRGMPSHWPTVTSCDEAQETSAISREAACDITAHFVAHCQEGKATGEWEINELYEWFVEWCHLVNLACGTEHDPCAISPQAFQKSLSALGIKSVRKWERVNGKRVGRSYRVIPELITLRLAA